jgi:type IV secretory pathway ATPase VirB11/archaellum biosynthesis ATPase
MAVAIRKHVAADLGLEEYETSGAFSPTVANSTKEAIEEELT